MKKRHKIPKRKYKRRQAGYSSVVEGWMKMAARIAVRKWLREQQETAYQVVCVKG